MYELRSFLCDLLSIANPNYLDIRWRQQFVRLPEMIVKFLGSEFVKVSFIYKKFSNIQTQITLGILICFARILL